MRFKLEKIDRVSTQVDFSRVDKVRQEIETVRANSRNDVVGVRFDQIMASHKSSICAMSAVPETEGTARNDDEDSDSDDSLAIAVSLQGQKKEEIVARVKEQVDEEFAHLNSTEQEIRSAQILELISAISEASNALHFDLKCMQLKDVEISQL